MTPSAQYAKPIRDFLKENSRTVLGNIVKNHEFGEFNRSTRDSWLKEIADMQEAFKNIGLNDGYIFFEYVIPRVGGRIDCGIITKGKVFIIEFKTGDSQSITGQYSEQLTGYVRNLKMFHFESYETPIIPILAIEGIPNTKFSFREDPEIKLLYKNIAVPSSQIGEVIKKAIKILPSNKHLTPSNWINSPYCPTSDIVDAARKLFDNHTVDQIKRSDAKGDSLEKTTNRIMDLIHYARDQKKKIICMVTGVPGAGKTLIGLSVATRHKNEEHANRSVYLSGNHPLVTVLQEALTRDALKKKKADLEKQLSLITDKKEKKAFKKENKVTKKATMQEIIQFIQEIYLWRSEYLKGIKVQGEGDNSFVVKDEEYDYHGKGETYIPYDHVAIFDEAQRTWDANEHSNFVRKKSRVKITNFPCWSEARFLISCMDRHKDWAVIVCLVGNGQDINHGEAGINDWFKSLSHFPEWILYAPPQIKKSEDIIIPSNTIIDKSLHLEVSLRSIRAENLSKFVDALLLPDANCAAKVLLQLERYPIVMTRDYSTAKSWLKKNAQPYERYGIVASSKAQRLKPLAIDVSHSQDMLVANWFLNDENDVHSSFFMEDIATEFQVQGLELDWVCLAWDGDLLYQDGKWIHRRFRGMYSDKPNSLKTGGWQFIRDKNLQDYHINAYRVLLTRARRGMIILIPEGDLEDKSRQKHFYDQTYNFFKTIGIPEI